MEDLVEANNQVQEANNVNVLQTERSVSEPPMNSEDTMDTEESAACIQLVEFPGDALKSIARQSPNSIVFTDNSGKTQITPEETMFKEKDQFDPPLVQDTGADSGVLMSSQNEATSNFTDPVITGTVCSNSSDLLGNKNTGSSVSNSNIAFVQGENVSINQGSLDHNELRKDDTFKMQSNREETSNISTTKSMTNVDPVSRDVMIDRLGGCYCDKVRDLNTVELQCAACFKWFHERCITAPIGKCLPFMTNYTFVCKNCSQTGAETFAKRQSNFSQICLTAIANLMQESISRGKPKSLFSRDKEIVPFIDRNWPYLTTMQRRIKQTWHNTVQKTMLKDGEVFVCEECLTENNLETQQLFGIAMQDLYKIGPDYENKLGHNASTGSQGFSLVGKSRGAKRKTPSDNFAASASKKPKSDLVIPKLPPHGYPLEHPFNKDGYRYILAEPDPHAPFRQEFDESSDWAGKPIPGWLYRTLVPNSVLLAMHDRAPQLRISEDRLSVTGEKGYCMVRATHGVGHGSWYFECTIDDMPEGSATRLGWSQSLGNLQAPLGFDKFSYSWRSRKGTKFHQSRGFHFSDTGYVQGDTLGFLINLPLQDANTPQILPSTFKDKPLVKFKSYLYFEEKDEVQQALKELRPMQGSSISYYKNGVHMGVAWEDIFSGIYYPAISLYKSCTVSVNFGPNLKYPPTNVNCKLMYEAGHKALVEQTASDLVYFTENDGKLRLDSFMC